MKTFAQSLEVSVSSCNMDLIRNGIVIMDLVEDESISKKNKKKLWVMTDQEI